MPEECLFRVGCALQGIFGYCQQLVGHGSMEVRKEGAELVAQHALGKAKIAGSIIGTGCLTVALKIDLVAAQVEPGEGIVRLSLRFALRDFKGMLAVQVG